MQTTNNINFGKLFFKPIQFSQLNLPSKQNTHKFVDNLLEIIFPHFSEIQLKSIEEINNKFQSLIKEFEIIISPLKNILSKSIKEINNIFFDKIHKIHKEILKDAQTLCDNDPASYSIDEVILSYPGLKAIAIYRLAHELYILNVPFIPRIMTEYAHQLTGIDIHPGAVIGNSFFIDHGTGIVIGETTIIGNNVKIYQGVTLGALNVSKDMAKTKRHPTIEDNVIIYSNTTILGGNTIIGKNSIIGGNVWLTKSINSNSIVYHTNQIKIKSLKKEINN